MTRQINVRNIIIGGGAPVSIQSMTNTPTEDPIRTAEQIRQLQEAGCEIVRIAVPNMRAADSVKEIRAMTDMPLVADIHFDHRLALKAVENGIDKIRINPGNIGDDGKVREVAYACAEKGIPIRIGVNAGSLEKRLLEKYGGPTAEAMVESAFDHIAMLEKQGFFDICVSLKASSVPLTMAAYRLMSERSDYPLHLGVTEAGTEEMGVVKSAMGIGGLLCLGIGDTLRVSLSEDPVKEIAAAKRILTAAGLRRFGPEVISCPTCGRTKIDLFGLAKDVQKRLEGFTEPITVAVMGCVVNGPGEASHADVGIAGGDGVGAVFAGGKLLRTVPQDTLADELMIEIHRMIGEKNE
ncbi:MAG: flavodoxin-dependent (E)-4-hydroxy-3-methylbut-2-enyl-diphosphate synthase [Ruminococcaceae bacterium]|nr:flavodoxin-dependent (E)-4-hydroxy-3-methylbut-2-enyl-diphosphate synthase [Oscillospiraceae bacterium]